MSKDKLSDYSTTANSNQDLGGVGILGTNAISNADDAFRIHMKHHADWEAGTAPLKDTATFADPSDLTKEVRLDAGAVTAGQTRVLSAQDADGIVALTNVEGQSFTGGGAIVSKDLGTVSSGTHTVNPSLRGKQRYVNGGAHTLSPGANYGAFELTIVNNSSAGAITRTGWTKSDGDSFTTTNGHIFKCYVSVDADGSLLSVKALQ